MTLFISPLELGATSGERIMLEPLLGWLEARRWIRGDSVVVEELPLNGRRVDVSTLTRSGSLSAYELKLGSFGRALEQAFYNRRAYDKSWIVLNAVPRASNLLEAERVGVGVLVSHRESFRILARPGLPIRGAVPHARVISRIRERALLHV